MLPIVFADVLLNITPCFALERGYSALVTSGGRVRCEFHQFSDERATVDWVLEPEALAELNVLAVCLKMTSRPQSFDDQMIFDGAVGEVTFAYGDGRRLSFTANSEVASLCSAIIGVNDHSTQ